MSLQPGDPFPRLELRLGGQPFRPEPGPAGQLYYFMRTADCPVCRAHVKRLITLAPRLTDKGLSVVVVVPEGEAERQVAQSLHTPFPVVQGVTAHASIGLQRRLFLVQQSGTVIHDAARLVTHVRAATLPGGSFDEDAVLELLK